VDEVFLHVGLQKTGTTWIQCELFDKMEAIKHIHDFRAEMYLPKGKKIISMEWIAGESFWPNGYETRYQNIERFKGMFPNAKIIVGFREAESWIRSTYSQYVKNGGIYDYYRWRLTLFDERMIQYDDYIKALRETFDEVFVYWFEEMKEDKQKFVQQLCDFMDVPVPLYEDKSYNIKFSDQKLDVLRFWNRWFYHKHQNPSGRLPGFIGYFGRVLVLKVSGSWQ
jgi:hypothetical protein